MSFNELKGKGRLRARCKKIEYVDKSVVRMKGWMELCKNKRILWSGWNVGGMLCSLLLLYPLPLL